MKTFSHLWQYLVEFFLEWEMFQIKVVKKIKTHILCSITFFRKSRRLWDNVEKYGGARGATNYVTIWRIRVACWISKVTCSKRTHTPTLPGTCTHSRAHTHTQICNTYCLCTATVVTWTHLCVTLCVHCLPCYVLYGFENKQQLFAYT